MHLNVTMFQLLRTLGALSPRFAGACGRPRGAKMEDPDLIRKYWPESPDLIRKYSAPDQARSEALAPPNALSIA